LAAAAAALEAQSVNLQVATGAPANSEWHNALRELDATVRKTTAGRVTMMIHPGGRLGSEKATVERMSAGGSVNASLLTAVGLAHIDDAFNVFGMPFFFRSDEEMRYVRERLLPVLSQRMEPRGFKLVSWGEGGWVQLFSKIPLNNLADIKRAKLYTSEGNDKMVRWYKANGFNPVALPDSEIIKQLQVLNGVEAVPAPPYLASLMRIPQYAPFMVNIRVAPLVGAFVMTTAAWNRLSPDDRTKLTDAANAMQRRFDANVPKLDTGAIAEMQKPGRDLKVINFDQRATSELQTTADQMASSISVELVPKDILDHAIRERDAFRRMKQP
jgi:TRAP-type C4-dicarboxylate transport system substrate-binding protein